MLVLVISDIHGNYHALKKVLEDSKRYNWKELWFLGDLGGYGPQPEKCFQLLKQHKSVLLPGNHDLYLTGQLPGAYFSDEALKSLVKGRGLLPHETLAILKSLPPFQTRKGITLVHGSPEKPSTNYILSETDAEKNFSAFKGACCLFGHTHIQEFFQLRSSGIVRHQPLSGETVNYKGSRILINPGSVGQPRDRDPRAAWCTLDTRKKEVTFYRSEYDIAATQKEMHAKNASDFLIQRLEKGI